MAIITRKNQKIEPPVTFLHSLYQGISVHHCVVPQILEKNDSISDATARNRRIQCFQPLDCRCNTNTPYLLLAYARFQIGEQL